MRTIRYVFATLTFALCACGQKDPAMSDASESYFPLVDGSRYEYLHSNGGWTEIVEIEEVAGGLFEQHQEGDPNGESSVSTFDIVDGDVLRIAEDQLIDGELVYSAVYDPGFLRFSEAWVDAEPGSEERRLYDRTETEAGMDPKSVQPRAHTFTVESVSETVDVPAGTFRNCVRVRRQRALDDPSIDDPTAQTEQDKRYWFAPGVGKVQEENTMSGSTEVLVMYEPGEE